MPALRQPGVPVIVVDSPNVARRPDRVRSRGVLADSHLASPRMINHCLDHLLSACLYVMRPFLEGASKYSPRGSALAADPFRFRDRGGWMITGARPGARRRLAP
ncbi:hypothetical protein GCM10010466_11190 [Planomonospora alba]|uniref:Uncharacterized protein n=1 Tax=Planomonospora alba TaxID=161354 RepID=A0ABP6MQ06_9ACTN